MSKKRREPVDPITLFKRRAALGVHLLLQACVLVGSQGAWWDIVDADSKALILTQYGHDATRATALEPVAAVAALAAIVAFFFASYDLVSDADLQAPILLASLVALGAAAAAFHRGIVSPAEIERITREVNDAVSVAPVTSGGAPPSLEGVFKLPLLIPRWGLALLVAAAPLMVVVSTYLTFSSDRSPEQP